MLTLDVLICTYGAEGILRVSSMTLPRIDNIRYVISWQNHKDLPLPENLIREDIKISRLDGKGLSLNRNNALANASSDLIYICDDDITILPGALQKAIKRFEDYPDTDVATFKMKEEERKNYPKEVTDLKFRLPKGYNVGACQMVFRRSLFPEIQFNTKFGINSGVFEVGEDEIFHLTLRKRGYKCRFFPDVIASHPHEATGRRSISDPRILHGLGAVITKSYPLSFFWRIPLKAYRLHKNKKYKFPGALWHLNLGALKSYKVKI